MGQGMTVDPGVLIAIAVPAVGFIGWAYSMETRLRRLETQNYAVEAQQRIILRGLVRLGIVQQEEIDALQQSLDDDERAGRRPQRT